MTGRGLEGRRIARQLIVLAVLCGMAALFVRIAQPGVMFVGFEPWYVPLIPVAGLAGYLVGLAWMVRIYRTDPEPDARSWRYRDP